MHRTSIIAIFILALGLGLAGDLLLRETPWGVNIFVWATTVASAVVISARAAQRDLIGGWQSMFLCAIVLGASFAWRAAPELGAASVFGICVALLLMTMQSTRGRLTSTTIVDYAHHGVVASVHAAASMAFLLFSDIPKQDHVPSLKTGTAPGVVRGTLLALPVLVVFGGLFSSADLVFDHAVRSVLDIDFALLIGHCFLFAVIAWLAGGFLRGRFIAEPINLPAAGGKKLSFGITEISIVLGSCILLFALFAGIQFRYLFGGAELVQLDPSLTYAEYARRGFFELVTVVALLVPLLLVLEWLLKAERPAQLRLFRALALVQIALLCVVITSAAQRMLMYQREYGLTEQRVYVSVVMGWLAIILFWYVVTVLRGRRDRFAFGAVASGLAAILLLIFMNPDDLIARTNIDRVAQGRRADVAYLGTLSDDAVPALLDGLSRLDDDGKRTVAIALLQRKQSSEATGWVNWNWSRWNAKRLIAARESDLLEAAMVRTK